MTYCNPQEQARRRLRDIFNDGRKASPHYLKSDQLSDIDGAVAVYKQALRDVIDASGMRLDSWGASTIVALAKKHGINLRQCAYCDADMEPEDKFCPMCGKNAEWVKDYLIARFEHDMSHGDAQDYADLGGES